MRRIAALSLVLLLAACDTDGVDPDGMDPDAILDPERIDIRSLSQDDKDLVGTWDWVISVSYFTASGEPVVETPQTTGRLAQWVFQPDGRALYYENGLLARETTYEVRKRTYGNGQMDALPSLQFGDGGYGYDFGTDGDMLVLDSTPVDGPQARFKRK